MIDDAKQWLQKSGAYPMARGVYRAVSPKHRTERRLRRDFFASLVKPGDLCFDIGANVGQSIEALRKCRAKVVALEPNPHCLPALAYQFGNDKEVQIVAKAVGAAPGTAQLHFSGTAATASLRSDWNKADDQQVDTEVVTLEQLIAAHGRPVMLKVDVEGFEKEVFLGLAQPVPLIYFEMHAREIDTVHFVLKHLSSLGRVQEVNAISEDHGTWLLKEWVGADDFVDALRPLPQVANVVVRMAA